MWFSIIFLVIAIIIGWDTIRDMYAKNKRRKIKIRTAVSCYDNGRETHVLFLQEYLEGHPALLAKLRLSKVAKQNRVYYRHYTGQKIIFMNKRRRNLSIFLKIKVRVIQFLLNIIESYYTRWDGDQYVKKDFSVKQRNLYWND